MQHLHLYHFCEMLEMKPSERIFIDSGIFLPTGTQTLPRAANNTELTIAGKQGWPEQLFPARLTKAIISLW